MELNAELAQRLEERINRLENEYGQGQDIGRREMIEQCYTELAQLERNRTTVATLAAGMRFKWRQHQRKYHTVQNTVRLGYGDNVPEEHKGYLLVITEDCSQLTMRPTAFVWLEPTEQALSLQRLWAQHKMLKERLAIIKPSSKAWDRIRGELYGVEDQIRKAEQNPNNWPK